MNRLEISALSLFVLSILWMHFRVVFKKESRSNLSRIALLDGLALLIVLTGFLYPKTYFALMLEDAVAEWITFYAFFLSGFIIVFHLWCSRKNGFTVFSSAFLIPTAVAIFCLFVAGEEASWGQRILGFKPPDLFLEQNYQQELNFHNLLKGDGFWGIQIGNRHLVIQIGSKYLVMLVAFFYGILFPLAARFLPPLKKLNRLAPGMYLIPYFILVIAMELIYPIPLTGEACEMVLGIIFLVHVFDTYPMGKAEARRWHKLYRLSTIMVFVFVLGIITAPLLGFLVYGSDTETEAAITEELQLLRKDFINPDADKEKILRKKRVHKRIYTAIKHDYFHLPKDSLFLGSRHASENIGTGISRTDRKGYFLDPWNNPYWVYYYRNKAIMIFYSFGANRKRDSNLQKDLSLKGDDVGVAFYIK